MVLLPRQRRPTTIARTYHYFVVDLQSITNSKAALLTVLPIITILCRLEQFLSLYFGQQFTPFHYLKFVCWVCSIAILLFEAPFSGQLTD